MSSVVETVTDLVEPILASHHFELVDVEFVKEGKSWYLRVFIDKPGGITIDECVLISDELGEQLDNCDPDPIPQAYYLEVSSPGIERVLKKDKHLEQNIGKEIEIKLFKKDENGKKEYQGILKKFDQDTVTVEVLTSEITIERKNIALIKTIYNW